MSRKHHRKSRVPSSRLGRFTRLGLAAGELALGGATEGLRTLGRSRKGPAINLLLTAGNAQKLARRLAGLRGAAMKMGQMLSMEGTEILPREFSEALSILRSAGNTMPDSQLRRVLGREWGKGWEARFRDFDYQPIAAASIGQVHRAVTADGRELALKIQFPGVAKSIASDIDNMATLLRLSRMLPPDLDISHLMSEAKTQLRREADYSLEAGHLKAYGARLRGNDTFVVPAVHEDLSTKRILAMDYLEGVPVESLGERGVSQAIRDEIGGKLQQLVFRELFEFREMQSDPNFANYLYQPESGRIALLDFGSTVAFSRRFADDYAGIAGALIAEDEGCSRHFAERLGYLLADSCEDYARRVLDIIGLVCEPILTPGVYDFARSSVFTRARDIGLDMMLTDRRSYVIPPPETSFLHRKLMGTFMLNMRIRARVNVQELIRPYLPRLPGTISC